jgi:peptide/nickel transport system ATP-binding protein
MLRAETTVSPPRPETDVLLEVRDLRMHFASREAVVPAVDGVTFSVARGRTLALVGESGCGKSMVCHSILRLIEKPGRIVGGKIVLHSAREGEIEITALAENDAALFRVRGGVVSMIFQEPVAALSPVHTIGDQVIEAIRLHHDVTALEAKRRALEMLRKVGLSAPEKRLDQYSHELSGGMRQRVVIAMALVCKPELLIADEPTTALDVTLQAQILTLIKTLQHEIGCSVLLVTHDLGVVAQMADDVAVMYLGRIVESGNVRDLLKRPRHPYTQGLLQSVPSATAGRRLNPIPGTVPPAGRIPPGCPFHPRCPHAQAGRCDVDGAPPLRTIEAGRQVACLRAEEIAAAPLGAPEK